MDAKSHVMGCKRNMTPTLSLQATLQVRYVLGAYYD
jgi:hypothetical protein